MQIKVKKLHPDARIPTYAHPGDAGFDVYAVRREELAPGERKAIPIGLSFELPEGYVLLGWDKSGLAKNHGIHNLAGVIDSGYRGEVHVVLINLGTKTIVFEKGSRVAQMLIQSVERAHFFEADDLSETSRGDGAWGSSNEVSDVPEGLPV